MARTVAVVPHTHWDREWYSPFQTFRLRLVDLLDNLLPRLEADPSFAHFMLDGQMAVVDDYLEVRPGAAESLRRLAASGRLSVGPWYALPDEFLVSGETLVRNLQLGIERAAAYGGAMDVGYLPDMFGHVAQMPQLLRQFGFEHAVVWRGVPATIDRSAFWWSAPDGSTVRAEYLPRGYGNGADLPDDAKALVRLVQVYADEHAALLGPADPLLWMNGTDHQTPKPWLGRVVAEANAVQDDLAFAITSLPAYLASAPRDGLPAWSGELRSGARANLLMGVASNRVDVKQAAARAERAIERIAEPLSALLLPAARWPGRLLDLAWLEVIRNSAHDSICACSHDDVGVAVLHRFQEATAIADGLAERALAALAARIAVPSGTALVVNPSARMRGGVVELRVASDEPLPDGAQIVSERPAEVVVGDFATEASADAVVTEMSSWRRLRDVHREPLPGGGVRVLATQDATRKIAVHVADIPAFGWRSLVSGPPPIGVVPVEVTAGGLGLDNGLVRVEVSPADATFAVERVAGLGRLVDGGDVGDTYNWCPPAGDVEVRSPDLGSVEVAVGESGPVRAALTVTGTWTWHGVPVAAATTVEVRAGERFVRVSTTFDNRVTDHRLRAEFPLPEPATFSRAECAFGVVERGIDAEGGPTEPALATFPSRRFVQAGGLTIAHEGLLEYELVDRVDGAARAIALTLVRSTGIVSQPPMATRPLPAGPFLRTPAAQMQGPVTVRYVVALGDGIDPYALADDAFVPLLTAEAAGGGEAGALAATSSTLAVRGAQVSAVRRTSTGGPVEVRVFNPGPDVTTVVIGGHRGWLVDLRGRPLGSFEETFPLGPYAIATARLDF